MPILPLLLAVDPPVERAFGDWVANCDNIGRCQAVALQPSAQLGHDPVRMTITRDPGPAGGLTIEIAPAATPGRAALLIDGKPVAPAILFKTGIRLAGGEAEGLARAMAVGRKLEVRDYRGKRVATISLSGSSATLRWVDAQQGRAGTLTALVARGTRPVTAVPPPSPMPIVPAVRAPKAPPKRLDALIEALPRPERCEIDRLTDRKPEIWRVDRESTLVLIPCAGGAYNLLSVAFVVKGGKAAPARFDMGPEWAAGPASPAALANVAWDPSRSMLSQERMGRGLGDCGTRQKWVWDGTRFRMIEAAQLDECRGAVDWPVIYRATPAWR